MIVRSERTCWVRAQSSFLCSCRSVTVAESCQNPWRVPELPGAGSQLALRRAAAPSLGMAGGWGDNSGHLCCAQTLLIPALWGKPWWQTFHSHNIEDNYVAVNKWWWLHSLTLKHHPGHFDLLFFFNRCHQKHADHSAQSQLTVPGMWLMVVAQQLLSGFFKSTLQNSDDHHQVLWRVIAQPPRCASCHGEGPSCQQTSQRWCEPNSLFLLCSGLPSSFLKGQRYIPRHCPRYSREPSSGMLLGCCKLGFTGAPLWTLS